MELFYFSSASVFRTASSKNRYHEKAFIQNIFVKQEAIFF